MKYFTILELLQSSTAEQKGIDNTPDKNALDHLKILIEELLDPVREKWGGPITVNSGYRSAALNRAVGGVSTSQHCLDQNTEVLTNNGWKNIDTIQKCDEVFSMNLSTGMIEQVPIDEIVVYPYDGNLLYADNNHVQFAVTDNHRMVVRAPFHKYTRTTDRLLTDKEKEYFDSLKTDNDKFHIELASEVYKKRRIFKTAGISANNNLYSVPLLRMCMAVISDGFLHKKSTSTSFGFNLKKERDKQELEDILAELGWHYTKQYSTGHERRGCSNVYNYYIDSTTGKLIYEIIGREKKIPKWFLSLSPSILRQLVITYAKFDGSFGNRPNENWFVIFSKDLHNIDMLQAMCILSGMRCVKKIIRNQSINILGQHRTIDKIFHLYIVPTTDESRVNEGCYRKFYYKGRVWCVNNRNTTLITRRNGKVVILGNSLGQAADITVGSKEDNKKLFDLIKDNFMYDQLIDEKDYSWVHVSYRPKRNRLILLHLQ